MKAQKCQRVQTCVQFYFQIWRFVMFHTNRTAGSAESTLEGKLISMLNFQI